MKFTKKEAVAHLAKLNHGFLSVDQVAAIVEPFGFKAADFCSTYRDTRSQHKGLTLNGVNPKTGAEYKEGDTCDGAEVSCLASRLCSKLALEYTSFFGRGSQLRECCRVLSDHLSV